MSDKTLRQSLRFASLARRIYGLLQVAYAQTAGDAGRLQQLGVPEIVVTGNLKFDARPDPRQLALGHRLRSERCCHVRGRAEAYTGADAGQQP